MEDSIKKAEDVLSDVQEGTILPEDGKEKILEIMNEEAKKSPTISILNDIKNNPVTSEDGELVPGMVKIDPETGEKSLLDVVENKEEISESEKIDNFTSAFNDIDINNVEITANDVTNQLKEASMLSEEGFEISQQTALELVEMLNKYNATNVIRYSDFPEEAKAYLDKYFAENGIVGHTVQANTIRNTIAEAFANELKSNIQLQKFNDEFNAQLEGIFDKFNEELSPLFMNFNNSREEYIKKISENITDEVKKAKAEEIIDIIHDSFELNRLREAAGKTKLKRYCFERPEKFFRIVTAKYKDNNYNIYDPALIVKILDKHLKDHNIIPEDDKESALRVVLVFCNMCLNYNVEDPANHAFMYYFTYTAVLLDIYKGKEYDQFAPAYLANVKKVIDNLRR